MNSDPYKNKVQSQKEVRIMDNLNSAVDKDGFTFNIDLTPEDCDWIIATAKHSKKYRNKHGALVVELTPVLMTKLAAYVLRPHLRFEHKGHREECHRFLRRKNNAPMKLAGYWPSTNEEEIIIRGVLDEIRELLQDQDIDGVEESRKESFISIVIRLLKGLEILQIRPKYHVYDLLNTKFGTYNIQTKQWCDADPNDELLFLHDLFYKLNSMADVERCAKEREATAAHA